MIIQPTAPAFYVATSFVYSGGTLGPGSPIVDVITAAANTNGLFIVSGSLIAQTSGLSVTLGPQLVVAGASFSLQWDNTNSIIRAITSGVPNTHTGVKALDGVYRINLSYRLF